MKICVRARDKATSSTAFYAQSNANDFDHGVDSRVSFRAQNQFPTKLGGGSWIHSIFAGDCERGSRYGFTRVRWDQGVPTDPSGSFGLTGKPSVGIPFGAQQYRGFSNQGIGGERRPSELLRNPQQLRDNTFNYYDNLTWQKGKHLLSIGVQATRYQQNYVNSSNYGFLGSDQLFGRVYRTLTGRCRLCAGGLCAGSRHADAACVAAWPASASVSGGRPAMSRMTSRRRTSSDAEHGSPLRVRPAVV